MDHARDHWLNHLDLELQHLHANHLHRRLLQVDQSQGPTIQFARRQYVNLSSNDYLALSQHPHLKHAAIKAIEQFGVGSAASRLISGTLPPHTQAQNRFAAFKHAQAALLCPTGYTANLAVLSALADHRANDLICIDKLTHASLIDAARSSRTTTRVFPHLHYDKLDRLLRDHYADNQSTPHHSGARPPRRFIVTDSVFSMDGDAADLPLLCDLADQYNAILIADEAHATGVLGQTGAGLCELQNVSNRVHIVVSTASKALGSLGGIVTACTEIIDVIINRARPFIYTTSVPPAQAAGIEAALDVLRDEPWRRTRLIELSARFRESLSKLTQFHNHADFIADSHNQKKIVTPIFPLVVGDPQSALDFSDHLKSAGFFAPAIRPPTVAPNSSRVRITLRADLDHSHLDRLSDTLSAWKKH